MTVRQTLGSTLIALWAIFTFGTRFPKRRVGESQTVVIVRAVFVLITRAFCFFAGMYYLFTWVNYVRQGDSRSFNVTENQNTNTASFTPPILGFYYPNSRQVRPKTISYHGLVRYTDSPSYNATRFLTGEVVEKSTQLSIIGLIPPSLPLTARASSEYMQVVVDCDPLGLGDWYKIYLQHPDSVAEDIAADSMANMYFFRPGATMEIRFSPLSFTYETDVKNMTTWEKVRGYFGFAKKIVEHSYLSRITHIPFSANELSVYNASTTALFVIRPDSDMSRSKEAVPIISFKDTVAKIGGIVSAVGGVIVFLFGVDTVSPWGILVRIPYFRNKITKNLAIGYDQKNGMSRGPFTTFPPEQTESVVDFNASAEEQARQKLNHQETWTYQVGEFEPALERQGHDAKLQYLKERIDELEIVLTDFYLDTGVFQDFASKQAEDPGVMARRATRTAMRFNSRSGRGGQAGGQGVGQLVGNVGIGRDFDASSPTSARLPPYFHQGGNHELAVLGDRSGADLSDHQQYLQMTRTGSQEHGHESSPFSYGRLDEEEHAPMLPKAPQSK